LRHPEACSEDSVKTSWMQYLSIALALLLISSPGELVWAQTQAQRAGAVAAQIPIGRIERVTGTQPAEVGTVVLWRDWLRTEPRGRVRVTLDDGSILNVGSESQLQVVQHDATTQQTDLTLVVGRMRARVTKLARGGRFEVRTNTAVLGVIGTDFFVEATATYTLVIVYEGVLLVQNINPAIVGAVQVFAGQQTTVPLNQPPQPPAPPTQADFQASLEQTNVGPQLPQPPAPAAAPAVAGGPWPLIITVLGVVAIGVVAGVTTKGGKKPLPPPSGPRTSPAEGYYRDR